jgi:alpha-tubulin suppressor-like RCC1 family protein
MAIRRAPFSNGYQPIWPAVLLFGLLFVLGSSSRAEAACGPPVIDKADYSATETVLISDTEYCAERYSCALTTTGGVKCWGIDSATPVDVTGLTSGVIQITLGGLQACALTAAGGVKCWNSNSSTPVDVSGLTSGVAQISGGEFHTCAVTTSGGAKCWGNNYYGALGNGTSTGSATPVDVSGLTSGVVQISSGEFHTCAVTTSGGAKCWGGNTYGQLGNGTFAHSATPIEVSGLTSGVEQISAGGGFTCAVTTGGHTKCWGNNIAGFLGNGTFTMTFPYGIATPVDVDGISSGVAQISAGADHTCAVTTAGGVKCWGSNAYGDLGNGAFTQTIPYGIATPVDVGGMSSDVRQVSAGRGHTCAVTTAGGVKCWGWNFQGQLGNGTFTPTFPYGIATPVDVSGLTSGVAALWDGEPISMAVPWTVGGFYAPVEMGGVWNSRKGGATVPIKFQVFAGSTELTDPAIVVQPLTATQTACSGGPTDTIELTATGGTNLRYDTDSRHFIFNWKTPKRPGYCYTITVALTNGASLSANFELR